MALVFCSIPGYGVVGIVGLWKVMRPIKYCRDTTSLGAFLVRGVKTAFWAFGAQRTMGSWA